MDDFPKFGHTQTYINSIKIGTNSIVWHNIHPLHVFWGSLIPILFKPIHTSTLKIKKFQQE